MSGGLTFKDVLRDVESGRRPWVNWAVMGVIGGLFVFGWLAVGYGWLAAPVGVLMLAEAMVLSFYLSHDCAHFSAFDGRRLDTVIGPVLAWLAGYGPFSFQNYRRHHARHHAEQIDLFGIDVAERLSRRGKAGSQFLVRCIEVLEWCYIPAFFFWVRWEAAEAEAALSFEEDVLVTCGIALRIFVAGALWFCCHRALICFVMAIFLRIHAIRFVDAFQHTYKQIPERANAVRMGWAYEQIHTFSFPVFKRARFLNWLFLNFSYHNAHHAAPHCPWYLLPRLDEALRRMAGDAAARYYAPPAMGVWALMRRYHAGRVRRVFSAQADVAYDDAGEFSMARFDGVVSDNLLG